jgi:hypothetical protein
MGAKTNQQENTVNELHVLFIQQVFITCLVHFYALGIYQ